MNRRARVFLVLLRIAVGWHFLYEGVWKLGTADLGESHLAARYKLQAATNRLSGYFEGGWRSGTLDAALQRADEWHDDLAGFFKANNRDLNQEQKDRLAELRDTVKLAATEAWARPGEPAAPVVDFDWLYVHEQTLAIPPDEPSPRFTALEYLQNSAGPLRPLFRGLARDIDGLERLTPGSVRRRVDERTGEILRHFAASGHAFTREQRRALETVAGQVKLAATAALLDPAFQARLNDYKAALDRVRGDADRLDAPYTRERLDADRKKLATAADELLAFANEPIVEMGVQARLIATPQQLQAGPPPPIGGQTGLVDWMVQWGLTVIGLCLMLGLFTPVAAVAAAAQLALFYLASPALAGLPAATAGGHFLYVDRNLIEMLAALAIATTGTGRWAGLDFYLYEYVLQVRRKRTAAPPAPGPVTEPVEIPA